MLKYRLRQIEALVDRISRIRRGARARAPRHLQTPQDVIELLHEQVEAIRLDALQNDVAVTPAVRCRSARDLLELGLKFREHTAWEQRLAAVEARLDSVLDASSQAAGAGTM
jgi:hypothetical protein